MKKFLSIILTCLLLMTMIPMAVMPASAAENLDYNITVEVVDWAVYEISGKLIGEFNAVEHGDAFYDVSLTQADDGTFTCSYRIALERNGGNTAWDENSISFKIDSCEDEFLQEFEKSCYSNYNIFYNIKVTRSAGHSFSDWADAGDGKHTRICSVCSETETQNHSFEGGNCLTVGKCDCGLSSIDINVHTKPVKYVVNSENNFKHDEVYECCGVINSNLDHKYDSKGMCKECKYQCEHSSFTDSICDYCGYNSDVIVIDGTLGGKTTATKDDVNALVEELKGYVDSGITTIIVTGSEPALHNFYGIDTSAVSAALYYLADNDLNSPYCGTIDLILPDVTEIVDDEFNNTFALNSITLPKVTKLGNLAFYAAQWLQRITFGSVLTDVNETGGVVFAAVGEKVGGCDLILNCGQMNSLYIPDLDTNTWKFRYENEFKSITLTHNGGEATCTEKAICETCGEEYGDVDSDAHDIVIDEAVAPDCVNTGFTQGEHCTRCDYKVEQEVLPALNHKDTLVQVDAKAPTCTEAGYAAYEYCTACDYTTYAEKEALDHDIIIDEAVAPKCGETGLTQGQHCSRCDAMTIIQEVVPALTHKDDDGDYLCDYGCGHEFEKPVEPEQPDTPDEPTDETCTDCGKVHTNFFSEIICFFIRIFNFIKNLFA